jgi:hypothetical protein
MHQDHGSGFAKPCPIACFQKAVGSFRLARNASYVTCFIKRLAIKPTLGSQFNCSNNTVPSAIIVFIAHYFPILYKQCAFQLMYYHFWYVASQSEVHDELQGFEKPLFICPLPRCARCPSEKRRTSPGVGIALEIGHG